MSSSSPSAPQSLPYLTHLQRLGCTKSIQCTAFVAAQNPPQTRKKKVSNEHESWNVKVPISQSNYERWKCLRNPIWLAGECVFGINYSNCCASDWLSSCRLHSAPYQDSIKLEISSASQWGTTGIFTTR